MALINALDRFKHFSEFSDPLNTGLGVLTPAQRRAAALANLFNAADTNVLAGSISFSSIVNNLTASGVGTVAGGTVVAEEHGDSVNHLTKLTLTAFSLGNCGDNASLGIGAKFYSLPAGAQIIENASINGAFTTTASVTAQTPVVGIGTVVASGAVAVLSGTATFQNVMVGAAVTDLAGAVYQKATLPTVTSPLLFLTTGGLAKDLFLNAAVAWADVTAAAPVLFTGTIIIKWRTL